MSNHRKSLDRFYALVSQLPEEALTPTHAAMLAMVDPLEGAEFSALPLEPDVLTGWLQAHGWLTATNGYGPKALAAMARHEAQRQAEDDEIARLVYLAEVGPVDTLSLN
jgi:hypothetical protein